MPPLTPGIDHTATPGRVIDPTNLTPADLVGAETCHCGAAITQNDATGSWYSTDGFSNCHVLDEFGIRDLPHAPTDVRSRA